MKQTSLTLYILAFYFCPSLAFRTGSILPVAAHRHLTRNPFTHPQPVQFTTTTQLEASGSSNNTTRRYEYKDDCFGILAFMVGVGTCDAVFEGVFVTLTLAAAFATAKKWLPVDPKRDTIVDRKVPGIVAALTLLIAAIVPPPEGLPIPVSDARTIQGAIAGFSIVTAFLDIRWRDRFDYPEEFRD